MCLGRRFADLEIQVLLAKVSSMLAIQISIFLIEHSNIVSVAEVLQARVQPQTPGLSSHLHVRARRRTEV